MVAPAGPQEVEPPPSRDFTRRDFPVPARTPDRLHQVDNPRFAQTKRIHHVLVPQVTRPWADIGIPLTLSAMASFPISQRTYAPPMRPRAAAMRLSGWFIGLLIACFLGNAHAEALRVAFVNPGKSDEAYWVLATQAMQVASSNLGMDLEVHYAERDHLRMVDLVREIAQRPTARRPNYLVLVNERRMGAEMLKIATGAGIKCLFAFNTLGADEIQQFGRPRTTYPLWLGSIVPHAEDAGYMTAQALIERGLRERRFAADGKLHLVAIAGDRATESSVLRTRGMERAVHEHAAGVVLDQTVYADWKRDTARSMAQELFVRYPDAALVWSGNDLMAFGAIDALTALGGKPGVDRFFSAINTSNDALQGLIDGRIEAVAGGHFMAGAWALVLIHDHAHGRDFSDEGVELDKPMFILFDPALARRYRAHFSGGVPPLDFRRHSKVLNPQLLHYGFDFASML